MQAEMLGARARRPHALRRRVAERVQLPGEAASSSAARAGGGKSWGAASTRGETAQDQKLKELSKI